MQYDSSTTGFPVLITSVLSSFFPITANQGTAVQLILLWLTDLRIREGFFPRIITSPYVFIQFD